MRKYLIVFAAVVPLIAVPVLAGLEKPEKRERRICKREMKIGSNVAQRRICLTAAEWKETERLNQQTTKEWQNAIDGAARGE